MRRKTESVKCSGVSWSKSIDVPEMPLSYNFTGIKKTVIPNAFTMPAIVSIKKLVIFNLFIIEPTLVINFRLSNTLYYKMDDFSILFTEMLKML